MKPLIPLLFALGLVGCATPKGTVVQDQPPQAEAFWAALQNPADRLGEFLASDAAKKNAPLFFKVAWRLSFAGYAAADGDVAALASNIVAPTCDAVLALTEGAVTPQRLADVVRRFGADWRDEQYAAMTDVMNPIVASIVDALPDQPRLALFYLRAVAEAGRAVCKPYLDSSTVSL